MREVCEGPDGKEFSPVETPDTSLSYEPELFQSIFLGFVAVSKANLWETPGDDNKFILHRELGEKTKEAAATCFVDPGAVLNYISIFMKWIGK